ncbi:formate dehydrogenase accessory sulfurtransferase FdhD [Leeia sp. TBRC 13508]|uniref:Sulfur carrier protein FdhD n=1 Tax=Leeia speluncae TaxID=2884804 RepID=A0ABS8D7N4_9NEIS|nr:formate dehydrogenase accessory sulfurtransferase FdhD [Leeia speluncae]MCB6184193.1 formate dehydrogenase accessory sulfurtransferase FdhD [Leeia speluncae]
MLDQVKAAVSVSQIQQGEAETADDWLATEVPVALEYNGISHVVLMATPDQLAALGLGFSLSEQIIQHPQELFDVEVIEAADGWRIQMEIATPRFLALKERRRQLTGRTGCGLCGTESLADVWRQLPAKPAGELAVLPTPDYQTIRDAFDAFSQKQPLFAATGACHGAAWLDANSMVSIVCEDVGRHNALDKLIGTVVRQSETQLSAGSLLLTSRASVEMVQKSAVMGIRQVIVLSAPTALAVEIAHRAGISLIRYQPGKRRLVVF